jgi:hypothetical protein
MALFFNLFCGLIICINIKNINGDRRGRDHMVVGFTITYAISAYHH